MQWTKTKTVFGAAVGILLMGAATNVAIAQSQADTSLTPQQIIQKSQDAYSALSSYSDDGKEVSTIGASGVAPHTFTIKLARPNLYRIDWDQNSGFFDQKGSAWSSGNGDFMMMGELSPKRFPDKDGSLAAATGISGGAAASIPGTFFKMNWGNQLGAEMQSAVRKSDEKIGAVDCYVLVYENGGRTRTLWIGKQDFLIRQVEDDTNATALKASLEAASKNHPELQSRLNSMVGESKSIQTHFNIIVNKSFSASDFDHQPSSGDK